MQNYLSNLSYLSQMAGSNGDYYISTTPVSDKKFSQILVGPNGATVTSVKIRGVDVSTSRNYNVLDAGYLMCAGGNDYFDYVEFSAGSAEGVLYDESPTNPIINGVTLDSSLAGNPMTPILSFSNTGNSGGKNINWRVYNTAGTTVQTGNNIVYFLNGDNSVNILNLTYYSVPANNYRFETSFDNISWIGTFFNIL